MMIKRMTIAGAVLISMTLVAAKCKKADNTGGEDTNSPAPVANRMTVWLTKADSTVLLSKSNVVNFTEGQAATDAITVDSANVFQRIDGFGYSLTGGSATLINQLNESNKTALLNELFGKGEGSIGVSYLRISVGASDLDPAVFSYNDLPAGETDIEQLKFSIAPDKVDLIPVLKKILAINPDIKIMGSPWSPPAWMKDNGSTKGGVLKPELYESYAKYLVKYIQAMKAEGIIIDALTPQNEPLHPGNNPSLLMVAEHQRDFIKNALGPAFQAAGIKTKIVIYDHNLDNPQYPISILNDPEAKKYIDGSAFHLYNGQVSAMSTVHNAHPDKNLYFTEQWTGSNGAFSGDLQWHIKNVIIGTLQNWSRVALEWNLASDPNFGPHTPGGCTMCKGALTINGQSVNRNVAYYIIAHASKFIPAGSKRVYSSDVTGLSNVAAITPKGEKVLIVLNDQNTEKNFNVNFKNKKANYTIPANSVITIVW